LPSPYHALLVVYGALVVCLAATVFDCWKRRVSLLTTLGLRSGGAPTDLGAGLVVGTSAMVAVVTALWVSGNVRLRFVRWWPYPREDWSLYILWWLATWAFLEELVYRGVLLSGLSALLRRRTLAVIVAALLFGAGHAANPHASWVGLASNAMGGVVYSLAFLGTGRLWHGTGIHFAWNLIQAPVLGFPMSGYPVGGMFQPTLLGPAAWTGNGYGPEASPLSFVGRFLAVGLVWLWLAYSRQAGVPLKEPQADEVLMLT
jgi:CAAX protease family protein